MKDGEMPRVSIGLAVYNGEKYLAQTLDSLLAQTFQDFELIISDNASTDHTGEICLSYKGRDERIHYIRNETNLGAAVNYNRVFELSSAEYFRWSTYDDLFAPESLARCVEILDSEPSVVLTYPRTRLIDEEGRVISDYDDGLHLQSLQPSERFACVFEKLRRQNVIYGLMRAEALRGTKLIRNFIGGDVVFVAELALYGTFREIPEFLFYRRLHADAGSNRKTSAEQQEFFDPKTKYRPPFRESRHLLAHFGSVNRAPLDAQEKMRLYWFLSRSAVWHRRKLSGELIQALRQLISGVPRVS